MKAIKKNMKDQTGVYGKDRDRKILHCPVCDSEFSGNAGDYFMFPDNHVFKCFGCQAEMELVTKETTVKYIK